MNNLEKLIQRKQKLLNELDKVYEQIALEKTLLQKSYREGIENKSSSDFEKRVRAKFRIGLK